MASSGNAVHWFNPENDLALAAGLANYTPPKAACAIREAGEALPLWYGRPGDMAICAPDERWLEAVTGDFGLSTGVFRQAEPSMIPRPWGWSAYARRHFEGLGFDDSRLPSPAQIEKMRQLSHRRTASLLAARLRAELPGARLAEAGTECRTTDDVLLFLAACPDAYLKSPWSSSGRGVIATKSMARDKVLQFAADSIRHQGSVMAEPACDKVQDFAMLFECAGGRCMPAGTSVFLTDARGAYTGNLLAPEAERLAEVTRHVEADLAAQVRACLVRLIDQIIAPFYTGVLGVDMLACADGTLNAAVELNLRTTMGYVAARFADAYLHPGARGMMRSVPVKDGRPPEQGYSAREGKLAEGTLHLSPPGGKFSFIAVASAK